ncbi:unnamed protein product [Periconia digitata]|uniref:AA9 family lytic polysaccharide monooxygenase n=1 Tax=Periconia digitata TaxID=1303443 RepID=A0A9W4UKZ6_9PLEO|nr:unnamed protein product [Periconia digitata]
MKTSTFLTLAVAGKLAAAHATFQEILVNGQSSGRTGVRGSSNANNPIYSTSGNLASDMMICKGGSKVSGTVNVKSGDKVTLQWHHNDPSSGSGDKDEPIAQSHKGPIIVWVATAASEGKGNAWVKIQQSGLNGGRWAVDDFISSGGKIDVTIPNLAAGDYLLRSEIIALHEASKSGAAQFYNGCAQIKVTSSGSLAIGSGAANIQNVYSSSDPGVLFNIYGGSSSYPIPGPAVNAGFGTSSGGGNGGNGGNGGGSGGGSGGTVAKYGQCGGSGYSGATQCESGSTCTKVNDYYSQCS